MNAEYRAIQNGHYKVRTNLDHAGEAILPSPYTEQDADNLYQKLIDLVPVGTKVRASYLRLPNDPASIQIVEGEVSSHAAIQRYEPSFHIKLENNFSVLVLGSELEAI